ncbi:MAG: STAS domain-containing protein [Terriglobales bacterium]
MRKQGKAVIFDLEGKLVLGPAVDDFRTQWSEALAAGCRDVVVNLSNVPAIDSSGIGILIRCHSAVVARRGKMKVIGASGVVRKALEVTHVDQLLEFHESEASALASLGA